MLMAFGGLAAPLYALAMLVLGLVMMLIYAVVFFSPYQKLKRAVAEQNWKAGGAALGQIRQLIGINLSLGLLTIAVVFVGRMLVRRLRLFLRRGIEQAQRGEPDGFGPRLALQFGMKSAVAIQVDRRQMEDVEVARHAGGFADVDFIKCAGDAGQRLAAASVSRPGRHRSAAH